MSNPLNVAYISAMSGSSSGRGKTMIKRYCNRVPKKEYRGPFDYPPGFMEKLKAEGKALDKAEDKEREIKKMSESIEMDEVQFKTQHIASFLATRNANKWNCYCSKGWEKRLERGPMEDAIHLADCAWKQYLEVSGKKQHVEDEGKK